MLIKDGAQGNIFFLKSKYTHRIRLNSHDIYKCHCVFEGCNIMKTHVRGFFDTDLHEVSWHFATHEAVRPSGF